MCHIEISVGIVDRFVAFLTMKVMIFYFLLSTVLHFAYSQNACTKSVEVTSKETQTTFSEGNCSSLYKTTDEKIKLTFDNIQPLGQILFFDGNSCFAGKYAISVAPGLTLISSGQYVTIFSAFTKAAGKPDALTVKSVSAGKGDVPVGFKPRACGEALTGPSSEGAATLTDVCVWSIDTQAQEPVTLTVTTNTNPTDTFGYWVFKENNCLLENLIAQVSNMSGETTREFTSDSGKMMLIYTRSSTTDTLKFKYQTGRTVTAKPGSANILKKSATIWIAMVVVRWCMTF